MSREENWVCLGERECLILSCILYYNLLLTVEILYLYVSSKESADEFIHAIAFFPLKNYGLVEGGTKRVNNIG